MAASKNLPFVPKPQARQFLQLKVTLKYIEPKIWRRLLVPSDMPVSDLHDCLQISMGWENSHMHHFFKVENREKVFYAPEPDEFFGGFDDGWGPRKLKYTDLVVSDLLPAPKAKLNYEYDFGDAWLHEIVLEKHLPIPEGATAPCCVAGERACPPEDIGGIPGYYHMLETLKTGKKSEKKVLLEWLGGDYDPAAFDLDAVNQVLASLASS